MSRLHTFNIADNRHMESVAAQNLSFFSGNPVWMARNGIEESGTLRRAASLFFSWSVSCLRLLISIMGRSAPRSTKHKKLKAIDPFYKGDRKNLLDKNTEKCNARPANPDVQEVPRKLREIMHSKRLIKEGKLTTIKRQPKQTQSALGEDNGTSGKGCQRQVQDMSVFEKRRGETDAELLRRVEAYSRNVIAESKLESQFGVIITEDKHGNVEVEKSKVDQEIEKLSGVKKTSDAKKLKRKELDAKRKEKKQFKKMKRIGDFDHLQDQVKFGEVAVQPPTIKAAPRKSEPLSAARKPGAKQLLLNTMFGSKEMKDIRRELNLGRGQHSKVDRTVKRKLLSISDRRQLDSEREMAVEAYRTMKKQQQLNKK